MYLQEQIVWGTGSSTTVEVEIDASVFGKWKVTDNDTQKRTYFYYCYIDARQRGDLSKLFLMPLGVSRSEDDGRVNPETSEAYHAFCRKAFGCVSRNLISMTDGAKAYRCRCAECSAWFVQHFWVNHSRKPIPEFSRSEKVLGDVLTGKERDGMAGSMTVDGEWGHLKSNLPKSSSARTPEGRQRLDRRIRAEQFRRMTSTQDRWPQFLAAARRWIQKRESSAGLVSETIGMEPEASGLEVPATGLQEDEVPCLSLAEETALKGVKFEPVDKRQDLPDDEAEQRDLDFALWGDRYFESQQEAKCGRHAVNNMLGGPLFVDADLDRACAEVLAELDEPRALHARSSGWYSHSVLAKLFDLTNPAEYVLQLRPVDPSSYSAIVNESNYVGVLVNVRNSHWTCLAKHKECLFYVDSCYAPTVINEFDFKQIIEKNPMSFAVVTNESVSAV